MAYRLLLTPGAKKDLANLDFSIRERVRRELSDLAADAFNPSRSKSLTGRDARSARVGDWRILFLISTDDSSLRITRIRHRREVYRD